MPKNPNKNNIQGWIPDRPDPRDLPFEMLRSGPLRFAESVDLRNMCSPVEDQGDIGSCVANATAGNMELLRKKQNLSSIDFSRLFIYYNARLMRGWTQYDSGCYIRDAIKTLASQGVCSEKKWPYIPSKFKRKPTKTCYRSALNFQILKYYRITSLAQMKQCLSDGFPFVFGFAVPDSFFEIDKTGIMKNPSLQEGFNGGHAVMAVGYKNIKGEPYFIIRNSWGSWGDEGYFYMPESFIRDFNYCDDFWTIRSQEG